LTVGLRVAVFLISLPKTKAMNLTKYVWFVLCCIGCIYQVTEFTSFYFQYKVVSSVNLLFLDKVELPSVTWCIETIYLLQFPEARKLKNCEQVFGSDCNVTSLKDAKWPVSGFWGTAKNMLTKLTTDEVFNITLDFDQLVNRVRVRKLASTAEYNRETMHKGIEVVDFFLTLYRCYRIRLKPDHRFANITSLIVDNGAPLSFLKIYLTKHDGRFEHFHFFFGPNEDTIFNYDTKIMNIVKSDHQTSLSYSTFRTKLLPIPYETMCFDYFKATGLYNKQIHCYETCIEQMSIDRFGGMISSLAMRRGDPVKLKMDDPHGGNAENASYRSIIKEMSYHCDRKCNRVECQRTNYVTKIVSISSFSWWPYQVYHASDQP
jgi:hypothetical protein